MILFLRGASLPSLPIAQRLIAQRLDHLAEESRYYSQLADKFGQPCLLERAEFEAGRYKSLASQPLAKEILKARQAGGYYG